MGCSVGWKKQRADSPASPPGSCGPLSSVRPSKDWVVVTSVSSLTLCLLPKTRGPSALGRPLAGRISVSK